MSLGSKQMEAAEGTVGGLAVGGSAAAVQNIGGSLDKIHG